MATRLKFYSDIRFFKKLKFFLISWVYVFWLQVSSFKDDVAHYVLKFRMKYIEF